MVTPWFGDIGPHLKILQKLHCINITKEYFEDWKLSTNILSRTLGTDKKLTKIFAIAATNNVICGSFIISECTKFEIARKNMDL